MPTYDKQGAYFSCCQSGASVESQESIAVKAEFWGG